MQTVYFRLPVGITLLPTQLLHQQKRYRGKINIRKPKIYFKKAVLNELLTPFFIDPNKDKTAEEFCADFMRKNVNENTLSEYDVILAREARHWFENSKMIGCIHVNSIKQLDLFDIKVPLFKANIHYKCYSPHIIRAAIKDTPFEGLKPLVSIYTAFLCSPIIDVTTMHKILKKTKKLYLMAGVLEGHILTLDKFLKYGQSSLDSAQFELVQILQNAGGANLNRQLTHHQSTLISRLQQIGTTETTSQDNQ